MTRASMPVVAGVAENSSASVSLRKALLVLGLILAVALVLRLVLFVGLLASDDMATWQLGQTLAEGKLAPEHVLLGRIGVRRYGAALPTALVFQLFGISETTVMIYPIAASLLGIVAVWDITRRLTGSPWAGHLSATLLALCSLDVHYSTVALPDGPMAAVSLCALWCAIVGYRPERRPTRRHAVLLFFAGLLAAFAVMHKEAAIQLVATFGVWGGILLLRRQFRPVLWWLLVGLAVGVVAEHLLFYCAYGDPFERWEAMVRVSADNAATRRAVEAQPLPHLERFLGWLRRVGETLPAFAALAVIGIPLAIVAAVRSRNKPGVLLVSLYVLCVAAVRFIELTQTYSYQPRRLLPLAGAAAILLAPAVCAWRRPRWLAPTIAIVLLSGYSSGLVGFDYHSVWQAGRRLTAERWIHDWARRNADLVRERELYVDYRTYKALYVLHGLRPLDVLGIFPYCRQAQLCDEFGWSLATFREGAFFYENPRLLAFLRRYDHGNVFFQTRRNLPASWRLMAIVSSPLSSSWNAALYQIRGAAEGDAAAPPDADTALVSALHFDGPSDELTGEHCGWYLYPHPEGRLTAIQAADGSTVMRVQAGDSEPLGMISGRGGLSRPPSSPNRPDSSTYYTLRVPIQLGESADAPGPSHIKVYVLGYTAAGERQRLATRSLPVTPRREEAAITFEAPPELVSLRVMLQFDPGAAYELRPLALEPVDSLPFELLDASLHDPARKQFHGWYVDQPEGNSITRDATPTGDGRTCIDFLQGDRLRLFSGRGGPTRSPGPSPVCQPGRYLRLSVPLCCTTVAEDRAAVRLGLLGYDQSGQVVCRAFENFSVGPTRQVCATYMHVTPEIKGVRMMIQLGTHGVYDVWPSELIAVTRAAEMPEFDFNGLHQPERARYHGWSVKSSADGLGIRLTTDPADAAARLVIDVPEDGSVQLYQGGSPTRARARPPLCRRGEYLTVHVPIHVDQDRLKQGWADVRVHLLGYTKDGEARKVYDRSSRLHYGFEILRGYVVAEVDLHTLRLVITFSSGGHYELEAPQVRHYAKLPFSQ